MAVRIEVDTRDFNRGIKTYLDSTYPEAMARGFRALAQHARDAARQRTAEEYELHSDYIPRGILSTPNTDGQVQAAARSYARHHDLEAAVFLRPANNPRQSLAFMVNHETGDPKTPSNGGALAIPAAVENYSYRTSKGGAKKQYQAGTLLEGYTKRRLPTSVLAGITADNGKGKGGKGEPFVTKTNKGQGAIARRRKGGRLPLEILYVFKPRAQIKSDWGFEPTIRATVQARYQRDVGRFINRGGR